MKPAKKTPPYVAWTRGSCPRAAFLPDGAIALPVADVGPNEHERVRAWFEQGLLTELRLHASAPHPRDDVPRRLGQQLRDLAGLRALVEAVPELREARWLPFARAALDYVDEHAQPLRVHGNPSPEAAGTDSTRRVGPEAPGVDGE